MANASTLLRKENRFRRGKDKLARIGVTAGGIFVLITLMLIFFYLLYVIVPIFSSVSVLPQQHFSLPVTSKTALLGVDDSNNIAYRFSRDGKVTFVDLHPQSQQGEVVKQQTIIDNPTAYGVSLPRDGMVAYGTTQGQVMIVQPEFSLIFTDAHKQLQPSIKFPFGRSPLALAPAGEAITQLAISGRDDRAIVVGKTATNHLYGLSLLLPENVVQRANGWQQQRFLIADTPVQIDDFQLTPDGKTLYVLSGSNLYLYKLSLQGAFLRKIENVATGSSKPVSITLLSGANSLLVTNSDNTVSQWFEVVKQGQRQLMNVRTFTFSASPLVKIVPEYYRKGFFAIQQDGTTSAYYTAERKVIHKEKVFTKAPTDIAISPKANLLVTLDNGRWQSYHVKNAHPDIGLSSLLQKVWYEGYAEPDYVWQSTSASDEFEPKLSLVPIVFGTLKAALYSMFFAIPLALSGAIYTAYFMSNKVRKVIKPTVELMEALPTVILGFLAGVWLAPIVEQYLAGIALGIIFLPLSIIVVGWSWSMLPGQWRSRVPNGFHIALLIPVIVAVTYGCFGLSPWIESQFFNGDLLGYLNNHLGVGYDQRNALIVGIAMGFAVIPTIFTIAEDAIFSVPAHLTKGSLALGATQWQTLTKVVLLTASPGIFSAIMMGLGRAVGETMIVLMATGNTPVMDWNLLQGLRTLAATIAIEMPESEVGSSHYRVLFLAAFVLFVFTFVFNTIAEVVRQRLREKYSSL